MESAASKKPGKGTLYTLLGGGVDGPCISDGVDQATLSFHYLASPNPNPLDLMTVLAHAVGSPGGSTS